MGLVEEVALILFAVAGFAFTLTWDAWKVLHKDITPLAAAACAVSVICILLPFPFIYWSHRAERRVEMLTAAYRELQDRSVQQLGAKQAQLAAAENQLARLSAEMAFTDAVR